MKPVHRLVLILVAILLAGCMGAPDVPVADGEAPTLPAAGPAPDAASEHRPNVWLLDGIRPISNTQVSSGAEPSILADRNGKFLWIGDTSGGYYSEDNGTTWRKMANFLLPAIFVDGWALAQDETGRLYAGALTGSTIDVATSTDGKTWATTNRLAAVSGTTDRPWLAARGDGEVVLFYFDAPAVVTGIWEHCARSTDRGATWLDRDPTSGSPQGGNAIWDDAGNFYYSNDNGVVTRFAGSCAGSSQTLNMFNGLGANNMIQLATDGQIIYSAAATTGNKAIAVSGTKNFQQVKALTVSPSILQSSTFATITAYEDQVAVAWYGSETPGNPSAPSFSGSFNVYVAIIDDFWGDPVVRHIRVTDEPNHVGDICMGGIGCDGNADRDLLDYFMMDYDKWGGLHIAYGHDGAGSNAVVRYAQIPASVARPPLLVDGSLNQPPSAQFALTTNSLSVRVDASASSDPEGTPLSYAWSWGDGSPNSAGRVALHNYASYGAYTVTLTVTDAAGQTATVSQNILVEEAARTNLVPVADFEVDMGGGGTNAAMQFHDRSEDADGSIVAWHWDFGDGTTSNLTDPTHRYAGDGEKQVSLTVTDDWGESDTATQTIVVPRQDEAPAETEDPDAASKGVPMPGIGLPVLALLILARRR